MKRIVVFVFILICVNSIAQIPYGSNPKVGKYLNHRGFRMYYEIYGQGEPLLIIHGNGGSISNFENQIPYFSKKYQVILADSRAHGKSIDNNDSLSYKMMTDDLNILLDHLHKDSCYVIGWSDGGIEGLLLAINYPKKVKKLVITGANLIPDANLAVDPWIDQDLKHNIDSLEKLIPTTSVRTNLKLWRLMVREPHITHEALQKISCPTLVIGGDQDVILPRHTLEIAENIKQSNLWILPNAGHSTPIYYKDIFNNTVNSFFKAPFVRKEKAMKFN